MMIVIRSFYCCHIHCFLMSTSRAHVSILPIANEFVNWIISASTNFVGSVISWTMLLKNYVVSKFQILSCLKYECAKVAFFQEDIIYPYSYSPMKSDTFLICMLIQNFRLIYSRCDIRVIFLTMHCCYFPPTYNIFLMLMSRSLGKIAIRSCNQ